MIGRAKGTFLTLTRFFVAGLFLSVSGGYASVNIDLSNMSDRPAVLKSFARNYSHLFVTTDMEFDPSEEHKLDILIQYDSFVKYCEQLKGKGGFREGTQDFIELTVGDDDFVVSWDEQLRVFLTKAHAEAYDINIEPMPTGDPSQKKYKLTLTKKPA